MKSKKPTQQDKAWQKQIEKKVDAEKVKLDHPQGKERFAKTLRNIHKKIG